MRHGTLGWGAYHLQRWCLGYMNQTSNDHKGYPYSRHMYRCRHSLHDSITQYLLSVVLPIYPAERSVRTKYQCSTDTQFPWQCSPAECCRSAEPVPVQGAAANFLQSHRRGAPALSCIMLHYAAVPWVTALPAACSSQYASRSVLPCIDSPVKLWSSILEQWKMYSSS